MGAGLAAARPKQESIRLKGAEDRGVAITKRIGVAITKWMQNSEVNLVVDSVAILAACNLAISIACNVVARAKLLQRDKWSTEMPPEILCSISDYLPLIDCMSFRRVCKGWRSAPFGRSEMASFSHDRPWLLFYGLDDKDDTCYLYSESHPKCCTLKLPGLRGATCVDSMYGWLLARRGRRFFFYNAFSMEKIELEAEYPHSDADDQVCTFELFPPPSPLFTAVVVSRREQSTLEICSCRVGDKEWCTVTINIGELEFGTLIFANAGCFENDGHIYMFEDSLHLIYNISRKECTYALWDPHAKNIFFDGIRAVHQNDWLFKFGKKGISVSTCALHMIIPAPAGRRGGTIPSTTVVAACGSQEAEAGLKNVRAVWIQPPRYRYPPSKAAIN